MLRQRPLNCARTKMRLLWRPLRGEELAAPQPSAGTHRLPGHTWRWCFHPQARCTCLLAPSSRWQGTQLAMERGECVCVGGKQDTANVTMPIFTTSTVSISPAPHAQSPQDMHQAADTPSRAGNHPHARAHTIRTRMHTHTCTARTLNPQRDVGREVHKGLGDYVGTPQGVPPTQHRCATTRPQTGPRPPVQAVVVRIRVSGVEGVVDTKQSVRVPGGGGVSTGRGFRVHRSRSYQPGSSTQPYPIPTHSTPHTLPPRAYACTYCVPSCSTKRHTREYQQAAPPNTNPRLHRE
jgi:hypothetical protein